MTQSFSVTGMTCQYCVSAVSEELLAVDGVTGVEVALGDTSTVMVSADRPLTDEQVTGALDEAGDYRLVPSP